jgi:nitroreductase/NAD-dependent dihydropyrimidine dehydrogenase PreA subunit
MLGLIAVDADMCSRCGACADECPRLEIEMSLGGLPVATAAACNDCGHCVAVCPTGALSRTGVESRDLGEVRPELLPSSAQVEYFLRTRRSVRRYQQRPVPRDTLAALLDTVRWAPTGGNTQSVEWVALDGDAMSRFAADTNGWLREHPLAPTYAATQARAEARGTDLVCRGAPCAAIAHTPRGRETDGAIALAHLELLAYAAGLGACWSAFGNGVIRASGSLRDWLGIPDDHSSAGVMLLGYPVHPFQRVPPRNPTKVEWR